VTTRRSIWSRLEAALLFVAYTGTAYLAVRIAQGLIGS
jgi:hypothetical protein